jgi:hypothetical protein
MELRDQAQNYVSRMMSLKMAIDINVNNIAAPTRKHFS